MQLTRMILLGATVLAATRSMPAQTGARVTSLRCDALVEPLGIDDKTPALSWKLNDARYGARQSAYRIRVFAESPTGRTPAPFWDSGRVTSSTSTGVRYAGPALQPSTRYFWRVQVWGKDGTRSATSNVSWWETGLMDESAWKAKWIGYESPELHSLRHSGAQWITNPAAQVPPDRNSLHDFRLRFELNSPPRKVVLYTTGQDTAAAWVNGTQVMQAKPLVPWKQMPWGTYERQDITAQVKPGENVLAIQITRYAIPPTPMTSQTPVSACIYIVDANGKSRLLISDTEHWKAALNASGEWWSPTYDDAAWQRPEVFRNPDDPTGTAVEGPWPTGPVALLRRDFDLKTGVVSARLYATALGAYKFHINGEPVGDQILAPGWMDFREHIPYQVYDVTSQLHRGHNAIGAYLAPGWYTTPLEWFRQGNNYGDTQPALRAELRLEMADGSVKWLSTDETWKAEPSEIQQAEIYDGETLDLRKRVPGWDTPTFRDAQWHTAMIVNPIEPHIVAQFFPPIREERVMTAKAITSPSPGVYILDFGQNMAAVPRITVRGQRGDEIKLRFGEVLNPDGTLYVENLRTAKATDRLILAGPEPTHFQPEFTFHGFRYMEVTGLREAPNPQKLQAVVLHTDAPFTMRFATGNSMVNQLWSNIMWGQRSNFVGLPTDCPQRDERLGWTADAQVFWRTATFNMDLDTFTRKFSADMRGTQVGTAMYGIFAPGTNTPNPGYGAAWSDAGVIIPWTGWMQTGDRTIIDENWDSMERYLAQIQKDNPNFLWQHNFGNAFGDWLTPTITTPEDLLATAYWAYDVNMMREMAVATGRTGAAAKYQQLHEAIKAAFIAAYVRPDGTVGSVDHYPSIPPPTIHPEPGDTNKDHFVETQTGYVIALHMNLLPDELRPAAATHLVALIEKNHWLLGTGFLGTPYLLEVLSDAGYSNVAYRLLLNTEYPSWGYLIEHGATTTWERWNGDQMRGDPSMNSYNHYAYGAVAEWMYRYAAGIDTVPNDPGFHEIYLHPNFDRRLGSLTLDYESPYGNIHSDWHITGDQVTWHLTIPPNTHAHLVPERTNAEAYVLNGGPFQTSGTQTDGNVNPLELSAGTYTFTAQLKKQ